MSWVTWLTSLVTAAVVALPTAYVATRGLHRRWRRERRRHVVRLRLVDANGLSWIDMTCEQLESACRYGFRDADPWLTLEQNMADGWKLQVARDYLTR